MSAPKSTHLDDEGQARMVDVSGKETTLRVASATVEIHLNERAFAQAKANESAKGAIVTVAKLAGIQAAKRTSELIPLCHQIPLDSVEVSFEFDDERHVAHVTSTVTCHARTGVEMEALSACAGAALTVYDMLKSVQKDILITDLRLVRKSGGASGDYQSTD